ncbi:MAG: hypothetical protein ACT4PL_03040 [Phycisphaerales bacterium]
MTNTLANQTAPATGPSRSRLSTMLAGTACSLLALNLLAGLTGIKFPPEAAAQTQSRGAGGENVNDPPFNAAGQRKQMIEQLTMLNERIARLEARLDKGLSVKVTEMPAVMVKTPDSK